MKIVYTNTLKNWNQKRWEHVKKRVMWKNFNEKKTKKKSRIRSKMSKIQKNIKMINFSEKRNLHFISNKKLRKTLKQRKFYFFVTKRHSWIVLKKYNLYATDWKTILPYSVPTVIVFNVSKKVRYPMMKTRFFHN